MPRVTTAFAAALALFLPIGRPLLVGLMPAVGIGAGLLTTQAAFAQTAIDLFNSGLDKAKSGNLKGAIADWTKAIEIDPLFARAYYNLGFAKYNLKDYRGAIADYTKAIEYNPNYAYAYANRGIVLEVVGDLTGACADWRKAADFGDSDAAKWVRDQC